MNNKKFELSADKVEYLILLLKAEKRKMKQAHDDFFISNPTAYYEILTSLRAGIERINGILEELEREV